METLSQVSSSDFSPGSNSPPPVLIELDCGLGKRVLSYLLVEKYFPTKRTLILLQATSSLMETYEYFTTKYQMKDIGFLGSRTPSFRRAELLRTNRVVLATPQTFANVVAKLDITTVNFDIILINEIDKIVRRTATRRTLVFPYNKILEFFDASWIVGLSGTLRDTHMFITDTVRLRAELQTLAENLPGVRVITMDEIMNSDPNFQDYIEYTVIRTHPISDPIIEGLLKRLDTLVVQYRKEILEQARKEGLIDDHTKNLALIAGQLPVDSEVAAKYDSLLMMRKYLTGMLPVKFRPFLARFSEISKEEIDKVSDKSAKIQVLPLVLSNSKKSLVMVSYVYTGEIIQKYLTAAGFTAFFVSGMVVDKAGVINAFRKCSDPKVVLILTQVGERDLDIPEAKLIVVYDTVNTTKTMYQRFKRTRGGDVVCLYYQNTSEEAKVVRLLKNIQERYPWSTKIPQLSPG